MQSVVRTTHCFQSSAPSLRPASDLDRQILLAIKERCQRRARWGRVSMFAGLLLGGAALAVACSSHQLWARWPLLIAAALELGLVPCYTTLACRRLRCMIVLIDIDLAEGLADDGNGRVRTLLGVWRIIQDVRNRRLRIAPPRSIELGKLQTGAIVAYHFALRSGVVLGLECADANPDPIAWKWPSHNRLRSAVGIFATDLARFGTFL
jgi:hypothetical protein